MQKNIIKSLEKMGFTTNLEGNRLVIYNFYHVDGYEEVLYGINLPTKEIDLNWVLNKMNNKSIFVNFSKKFQKLIYSFDATCYPTNYGIGIFIFANNEADKIKLIIDETLKKLDIAFTNEFSAAFWVYRYKISKSKNNIQKIENI